MGEDPLLGLVEKVLGSEKAALAERAMSGDSAAAEQWMREADEAWERMQASPFIRFLNERIDQEVSDG